MKINRIYISSVIIIVISGLLIFLACEDQEEYPRTRLFSPVLNEELLAVNNTIIINMGKMKNAISYTLEISRDTFKTIEYTVEVDTNYGHDAFLLEYDKMSPIMINFINKIFIKNYGKEVEIK